MKKYKLLKDLPTFKAGERFYLDNSGNLCAEDRQNTGFCKLIAYSKFTLDRFPNILTDWFEEIQYEGDISRVYIGEHYFSIDDVGIVESYMEERYCEDDWRYEIGNYFRTAKEAERAKAKLEAYATVKRDAKGFEANWEDAKQPKYYVYYNHEKGKMVLSTTIAFEVSPVIYFRTPKDAENSLVEHPDEWGLLFDLDKEDK